MFLHWYISHIVHDASVKQQSHLVVKQFRCVQPCFQFLQLFPFLCLKSFFPPAPFCRFITARPLNVFCPPNFLPVSPFFCPANLLPFPPFWPNFLPPSLFLNLFLPSSGFLSPNRFLPSLFPLSDDLKLFLSWGGPFPGDSFLFLKCLGGFPGPRFLFAPGNMSVELKKKLEPMQTAAVKFHK